MLQGEESRTRGVGLVSPSWEVPEAWSEGLKAGSKARAAFWLLWECKKRSILSLGETAPALSAL